MKYLHKEDIEELGWFCIGTEGTQYGFKKLIEVSTRPDWDVLYYLYWDESDTSLVIEDAGSECFFNGYITNKEDLITLMRFLDIEC